MDNDLDKAINFHKKGQLDKAESLYIKLFNKNNKDSEVLQLLGTIYIQKNQFDLSETYLLKSLDINPYNAGTLNNLGILKKKIKDYNKALEFFDLNIEKNNFLNSWINKINILLENKRYEEGLRFSEKALKNFPNDIKIKNNYAVFLFNCGFQNESLKIYREFDDKGLHFEDSLINYSNILLQINNISKSLEIINQLLLVEKKNLNALRHRHLIYKLLFHFSKAEDDLLVAVQLDKLNFLTNKMLVELYIDFKKYEKAISYCNLMIEKKIEKNFFLTKKILSKINLGFWKGLKEELITFNKYFDYDDVSINPLSLKYINDNPLLQKKFSENYWNNKPKNQYFSNIKKIIDFKKDKIRIGYFSGDFRNHAVFYLIQDLFTNHNKKKFEILAYSSFKKDCSSRDKIKKNVDQFFDIDDKSDEEIIKLVKSHSLDIAIDLSGYTVHNKSHLFEYDIAKIKINYLGYPGTMGSTKYNFIISDENIVPKEHTHYYSEEVLYMPETYQPFNPLLFDFNFKKKDFNLPNDAFILASFSRIEKILPNIFEIWMKILNKYKDSYLALCINSEIVRSNIKLYCEDNAYDFNRIIFLNPINHKENLQRMSTFDLYLDTYPYNGHTGISDSLFQSCVPTISFTGNSFASRVSFSLLKVLNLQKLITYNEKEYYNKIDYYCKNRDELKKIKNYLINYKNNNLNRMKKFTLNFENILLSSLDSKFQNKTNYNSLFND